jgi:hypothetical protein
MLTAPSVGTLVVIGASPDICDTREDSWGWALEGSCVIWELRDDSMGWIFEGTGPEAEICDKSDEIGAKIELGSCAVNAGSTVIPALTVAVTWGTADLVNSEAWETMLDKIGCAEAGISVIWEASDEMAMSTPLAAGPEAEIREIKLETPGWIVPGSAVAWDAKEVSIAPICMPGVIWGTAGLRLIRSEACETIAESAGCADRGNPVIWDPRDDTATLTPLARGPEADIWEIKLETSGCNDAGRAVACAPKELRTAPTSTPDVIWGVPTAEVTWGTSELISPEICDKNDDNAGWFVAGSSLIWDPKDDSAGLIPVARGPETEISEIKAEISGCSEFGSAEACEAKDVKMGPTLRFRLTPAVADTAIADAWDKIPPRMGCAEAGSSLTWAPSEERTGWILVASGSATADRSEVISGCIDWGNWVATDAKDDIIGSILFVADAAIPEACSKILERIGWAEAGNSVICAFSEDKIGLTLVTRGLPIWDNNEDTGAWTVLGNWSTFEAREDKSDCTAFVAEAVRPDTRERSEERMGSIPVTLAWAPRDIPAFTEAPTPWTSEMIDDKIGWSVSGSWVIWAANDVKAGWRAVAEAPRSDTWPSRVETARFAAPVSTGSDPETPDNNEDTLGCMFEAEAPISETWLRRDESAGWMADAAGSNKRDEIPGSTPVGKVGMITAFPIVLTALVASARIDDTAEISGAPVMLASTEIG